MRLYIPPKFKFQQRIDNDIILGGDSVTVDTPLERIATLIRGGAMIPTGKGEKLAASSSFQRDQAINKAITAQALDDHAMDARATSGHSHDSQRDDKRVILAYPGDSTVSQFNLVEDDGITLGYKRGERTVIQLEMKGTADSIEIGAKFLQTSFTVQYSEIEWVFPQNERREVKGADRTWKADDGRIHASLQVPEKLRQAYAREAGSAVGD